MANTLTGSITADIEYRFYQEDDTYSLEDIGKLEYEMLLPDGTGYGQANEIWYAEREHSGVGVESIDLTFLSFTRLGLGAVSSFIGADIGNIKGIRIFNKSVNNLYARYATNSDFFLIPPSGDVQFSNFRGWNVDNGETVDISGNGSVQNYDIVLIGSTLPIVVHSVAEIPTEYIGGTGFNGSLNIEYIKDIANSGQTQLEWLATNSNSFDGDINIEYISNVSASGGSERINIEYKTDFIKARKINIEFLEGTGILPRNRFFDTVYTQTQLEEFAPDSDSDPYYYWDITWDDQSFPNNCTFRENNITLSIFRKNVTVGGVIQRRTYIGEKSPNAITISQTMNVTAGADYRFTCKQISGYRFNYYAGQKGTIGFYDASNVLIDEYEQKSMDGTDAESEIDMLFTSPDSTLTIKINKPENDWSSWQGPEGCIDGDIYKEWTSRNFWILWDLLLERQ